MDLNTSDNVFFYNAPFSVFLNKNPQIPLCQRTYIDERIESFYNKILLFENQIQNSIEYKIPYIGVLSCAVYKECNDSEKIYIMDGQHRFYAYKKYYENSLNDFNISYILKICKTKDSLVNFFKELNDNYNQHDIILDNFDLSEIIKKHIQNKYPKHISNSENPIYPNINLDKITKYIIDKFKDSLNTNISIINLFEELNNDIYENIKNTDSKYLKAKQGLYIGYLFVKNNNATQRKKIPITVRNKIWVRDNNDSLNGLCKVCSAQINISNFHAGHIISVRNGGTDNISNLVCICSCCNLSMGTKNLNEFKNKYF